MRRILLIATLAALLPIPAHADPAYSFQGLIRGGTPASRVFGGVTETLYPCNQPIAPTNENVPSLQGVDGFWAPIPSTTIGHAATLTPGPIDVGKDLATGAVDAYFYDADCNLIKPPGTDGDGYKDANAYSMVGAFPFVPNTSEVNTTSGSLGHVMPILKGTIPAHAAWVIVDSTIGAEFTFEFDVS
jgi:hypothetical protein